MFQVVLHSEHSPCFDTWRITGCVGIGVVNKPDKCKVKKAKGANHQSIANSSIPDLPDIIHPAADKEGEHLLDVEPEIVPETISSLLEKTPTSYNMLFTSH